MGAKKIKIVHLSRGFEDYVLALLSTLGDEVELYHVVAKADEWMCEEFPSAVRVIKSHAARVSSLSNFFTMLRLLPRIRKIKPDIIHLQNGVIWEGFLAFLFPTTPIVMTIHDVTRHPQQQLGRMTPQFFLNLMSKRADVLIVHGDKLRERAKQYYHGRSEIRVVPHGVITRYGEGLARPEGGTNVLFFGTVDKWKGVEYLIEAEPLVRANISDVKFKIAGGCSSVDYYSSLVSPEQKIELQLYRQSPAEVRGLFDWADIIVLPYIEASQSGVLSLAMNFSLPPIVTNVGSLPDIVKDQVNGLVISGRNPAVLAQAICKLLKDRELRKTIISNLAYDRINTQSRSAIALKTKRVYEELLKVDP